MRPLPIDAVLPELLRALADGPSAVLIAPPGAGKTTRVPTAVLDAGLAGDGRVLVLQPRRVAARSAAARIAHERGVRLGDEIGYHVRFDRRTSAATRVELLTEGLLTRRLQHDPFLEGVGCVILDEFHERSLHADLALALLREVQRDARDDLKVIVMSATLSPGPVATFLNAPVIRSEGRAFPVQIEFLERPDSRRPEILAAQAVRRAWTETSGDVLVFLPGVGEIERLRRALDGIEALGDAQVLPLHGRLKPAAQDLAIAPSRGRGRKIVLSTNIAETSVTIDGVTAVVDTGLAREPRYDVGIGLSRLELTRISRASADQRAGRAGRTAPGIALRLWTAADDRHLAERRLPEIQRVDLSRLVLELYGWGTTPERFAFFEPPSPTAVAQASQRLVQLGALERTDTLCSLTPLGRRMLALPLEPALARLVLDGARRGCLTAAAGVAALVSGRDLFHTRPAAPGIGDIELRLIGLARAARGQFDAGVDRGAARDLLRARDQLIRLAPKPAPPPADRHGALMAVLVSAFPGRVAQLRTPRSRRYHFADGGGGVLERYSEAGDAEFIVAVGLQGGRRGERSERRITIAAAIDGQLLPVEEAVWTRFDDSRGAVIQTLAHRFGAILLSERPVGTRSDPHAVATVLAAAAAQDPIKAFSFDTAAEGLLARLRWLAAKRPALALPTYPELRPAPHSTGPTQIRIPTDLLLGLCLGQRSFADLRRLNLGAQLTVAIGHEIKKRLDHLAPARITLPGGHTRPIDYSEDPPVLAARIQFMFGWKDTPRICAGEVPLKLHLLAPNNRPAQVTSDLRGFWTGSYADARKALRGRYPKHPWPEQPLDAPPVAPRRRRPR